jgi:hypothetical protein
LAWAAEIRDKRARPEAWLQREQWRSAQRALAAQGVELRKRTMPGMTPDNAPWWDQHIQLDPELERELDAFWAEEQERAAAEKHTRQIRAKAKAKAKRARTQKRPQT